MRTQPLLLPNLSAESILNAIRNETDHKSPTQFTEAFWNNQRLEAQQNCLREAFSKLKVTDPEITQLKSIFLDDDEEKGRVANKNSAELLAATEIVYRAIRKAELELEQPSIHNITQYKLNDQRGYQATQNLPPHGKGRILKGIAKTLFGVTLAITAGLILAASCYIFAVLAEPSMCLKLVDIIEEPFKKPAETNPKESSDNVIRRLINGAGFEKGFTAVGINVAKGITVANSVIAIAVARGLDMALHSFSQPSYTIFNHAKDNQLVSAGLPVNTNHLTNRRSKFN